MSNILKEGPIRKFLSERPTLILDEPLIKKLGLVKGNPEDLLLKRRITPAQVETIRID